MRPCGIHPNLQDWPPFCNHHARQMPHIQPLPPQNYAGRRDTLSKYYDFLSKVIFWKVKVLCIWYHWKAFRKCKRMVIVSCWYLANSLSYPSFKFEEIIYNQTCFISFHHHFISFRMSLRNWWNYLCQESGIQCILQYQLYAGKNENWSCLCGPLLTANAPFF